ncbi:MAG: glycogen debranching protein GlgX [Pseudomonadota bacterium]
MNARALEPGRPEVLGATPDAAGVNFAVFSQRASAIELCVFDDAGAERRLPLHGPDDGVFHGLLRGARAGLRYGFRAHGEWRPESGRRFNPNKLLLDPCARAIEGRFAWQDEHYGHTPGHPEGDRIPDPRDNAATALKAIVLDDPGVAPGCANRPRHRLRDVVLYELHVRGFTMQLPGIPDALRGTFAGLAHPAAIAHLKHLGVTTLSLLPVTRSLDERHLVERGLTNYWGYNPIGLFCPDPRLAADKTPDGVVAEFRAMVHALHQAGIEVVLDLVFNHTAEGDERGPLLCFRGLDNASWYSLVRDDRSRCENHSGCGNTLRVVHPRVTQFVLDALRFWVSRMGVDGFRYDLASVLGRTRGGFDPSAPFFVALRQDPLLADVHHIAEPWDAGHGGYQLGRFPGRFLEWNDRYRDAVRGYWLGLGTGRGDFARRITGSSDLFHHGHRRPTASVNYVAAHDGRTLADVVAYTQRRNEANGEGNRDGHAHEVCANFGVEGPTDDVGVAEDRRRARRAMLATVLLSQGTPMLGAGDEAGNSQQGNNNAYCQDNPTGWVDWQGLRDDADTVELVVRLLGLRRAEPLLRHDGWFPPGEAPAEGPRVRWHAPEGHVMQVADWHARDTGALACTLQDDADAPPRLALLFNPDPRPVRFVLPEGPWTGLVDSSAPTARRPVAGPDHSTVAPARSVLVLARHHVPAGDVP